MRILHKISIAAMLFSAVFYLGSCGSSGSSTAMNPTGSGTVTFDPVTKIITGSFTTTNVVNATLAHIHDGNVGVAGPVVVPLTGNTLISPSIWTIPANTVLRVDPAAIPPVDEVARLLAGGLYVNVHTTLNPTGEIRGQLIASAANPNVFNATLTLAQEVPAPVLPAGSGY